MRDVDRERARYDAEDEGRPRHDAEDEGRHPRTAGPHPSGPARQHDQSAGAADAPPGAE